MDISFNISLIKYVSNFGWKASFIFLKIKLKYIFIIYKFYLLNKIWLQCKFCNDRLFVLFFILIAIINKLNIYI
jgi:hypothetical protein